MKQSGKRIVFADTGYWIALLNPRDDLHERAQQISRSLKLTRIVTSEMVLTELLNDFAKRGEYLREVGVKLIKRLEQNPNTTVVPQSSSQFQAGVALYEKRLDKRWSLTDCVSFKIMEQFKISEALTYDRDFVQAGFQALLQD